MRVPPGTSPRVIEDIVRYSAFVASMAEIGGPGATFLSRLT
jgi:hypothetical protein